MKCPACNNALVNTEINSLKLDICKNGCGGVWFDKGELARIDEDTEIVTQELLRPMKNRNIAFDLQKKRLCPICPSSELSRIMHQMQESFVIDECPQCHGYWLDLGELDRLRKDNTDDKKRNAMLASWMEKQKERADKTGDPRRLKSFLELLFR